ncbi:hypothetical protein HispidOSU_008055, partial [Sigmodon hispidus]
GHLCAVIKRYSSKSGPARCLPVAPGPGPGRSCSCPELCNPAPVPELGPGRSGRPSRGRSRPDLGTLRGDAALTMADLRASCDFAGLRCPRRIIQLTTRNHGAQDGEVAELPKRTIRGTL